MRRQGSQRQPNAATQTTCLILICDDSSPELPRQRATVASVSVRTSAQTKNVGKAI